MKNINKFILEKLKINSKSKININNDIEIRIDQEELNTLKFSQEEIDEILEYCKTLPILPNYLSRGLAPTYINICYDKNKKFKDDYHECNIIRIKKISDITKITRYLIRFIMADVKDSFLYPEDDATVNNYYNSMEECFENINKYWKVINFSKHVEKYL